MLKRCFISLNAVFIDSDGAKKDNIWSQGITHHMIFSWFAEPGKFVQSLFNMSNRLFLLLNQFPLLFLIRHAITRLCVENCIEPVNVIIFSKSSLEDSYPTGRYPLFNQDSQASSPSWACGLKTKMATSFNRTGREVWYVLDSQWLSNRLWIGIQRCQYHIGINQRHGYLKSNVATDTPK